MLRELLIDTVNKWHISDIILLILLAFTFMSSWLIALFAGFRILNVKVKLIHSIPGALLLTSISLFLKPFIPSAMAFFVILIPVLLLLKFYSKSKWAVSFLASCFIFLSTAILPMLIISPLSSSNHNLELFFFKNKYGMLVVNFIETFGVFMLLVILNIFKIAMIPVKGQTVFIDSFVFGGLLYLCYYSFMLIWERPGQFLIGPCIAFMIAAGILVALCIRKTNEQKANEERDREYQELNKKYQNLKGVTDVPDFGDKLDTYFPLREQDVLIALAQGMDNQMMAKSFHLTNGTIANVISKLRIKLELESREQLVLFATAWVSKNKK